MTTCVSRPVIRKMFYVAFHIIDLFRFSFSKAFSVQGRQLFLMQHFILSITCTGCHRVCMNLRWFSTLLFVNILLLCRSDLRENTLNGLPNPHLLIDLSFVHYEADIRADLVENKDQETKTPRVNMKIYPGGV